MKKLLMAIVALLLVVGFAAYTYFTPQLTLRRIHTAAESGDTARLTEHVDFPAVRQSLKQQIKARIDRAAQSSANPFAALGSALAGAVAEPAVDALVTPQNVASLLRGESLGGAHGPGIQLEGGNVDMGYAGLNEFVVSTGGGFRLFLTRDGLLSWKLVDVHLPESWSLPLTSAVPRL